MTNRPTEHAPADCPVCKLRDKLQAEAGSDHRPVVKTLPDLLAEGYGWPPANYLAWGETEKVIDAMLAEDEAAMAIGDPFDAPMSTGAGVEYPGPAGPLGYVYLAGPMRGWQDFNFPAFHAAAKGLREQGWTVFNPAEMDEANGFDFMGTTGHEDIAATTGFDLRKALGADLEFITRRADAVAVLPGWEKSKGANAEVATARALGLPVFDALEGASRPITEAHERIIGSVHRWSEAFKEMGPSAQALGNEALFEELRDRNEADRFFIPKGPLPWDDPKSDPLADIAAVAAASRENYRRMESSCCDDGNGMTTCAPVDDVVVGFDAADPSTMVTAKVSVDGEVRTVSSTGGQKGKKPEVYDQIPAKALAELARHFGAGAEKYDAHNFRKGYPWSLCFNALMRHAWMFWNGEDFDVHKDGCPADCTDHLPSSKHIIAVAWHALVLATFMDEHPEFDDRYKPEASA